MARERLCRVCRDWHDTDKPIPHNCRPEANLARADFPVPMMNLDTIPGGVQSMVDGLWYESKSTLRKSYRAAGVVEVGNEPIKPPPPLKPKSNPEAVVGAMKRTGLWDQLSD